MTGAGHDRQGQHRREDDEFDVAALVADACAGDGAAWRAIVERYSPLLAHVVRSFRLSRAAQEDVAQTVWLRLVENLHRMREPRALPRWLMITAKHEALRLSESERRTDPRDPTEPGWDLLVPPQADGVEQVMRADAQQVLLAGLAELSDRHRRLLLMLLADPPMSYEMISEQMQIPVGSIGPTRQRALDKLRRTAALRHYQEAGETLDGRRSEPARPTRPTHPTVDLTGGERDDASRVG